MSAPMNDDRRRQNRTLLVKLCVVVVAMFGFGYALVPFYEKICEATGLRNIAQADEVKNTQVDATRAVRIEFDSNVRKLPWTFRPLEVEVGVHPGEVRQVMYEIANTTDRPMTGQAIPSYGPRDAAQYFRKLECFCFSPADAAARRAAADAGRVRRRPGAADGRRDDHAVVHVLRGRRCGQVLIPEWGARFAAPPASTRGLPMSAAHDRRQAVLLRPAAVALADRRLARAPADGHGRGVLVQRVSPPVRGCSPPASACCS